MVIIIVRTEEGLVQQRDTFPGGPVAFFSDVAQWSFVCRYVLYMLQTLVGDGVVVRGSKAADHSPLNINSDLSLLRSLAVILDYHRPLDTVVVGGRYV
jgi:hypothetical protein